MQGMLEHSTHVTKTLVFKQSDDVMSPKKIYDYYHGMVYYCCVWNDELLINKRSLAFFMC